MKASRQVYGSTTAEVADAARGMLDRVAAVAPEQVAAERRAFDMLCGAYFSDPERALAPAGKDGGGPLRFGMPGAQEMLTPVFLAAASAVGTYLGDRAAGASRGLLRRMFASSSAETAVEERARDSGAAAEADQTAGLTPEQWREVRRIVEHTLTERGGMPQHRARLLAAAVVGEGLTGEAQR